MEMVRRNLLGWRLKPNDKMDFCETCLGTNPLPSAPPPPPTDESISRSLSNSFENQEIDLERYGDWMAARTAKRATTADFDFIIPPKITLLREESRLRNSTLT
jgi:hypothetical protein